MSESSRDGTLRVASSRDARSRLHHHLELVEINDAVAAHVKVSEREESVCSSVSLGRGRRPANEAVGIWSQGTRIRAVIRAAAAVLAIKQARLEQARSTSSSWPWESARREIDARAWALRGAVKVRVALPRLVLCYVARVRRASFDSCKSASRRDPLLPRRYSLASAAGPPLRGTRRQPPPLAGACAGASLGTAAAAHSSRPVLRARDLSGAGVPRLEPRSRVIAAAPASPW